MYWAIYSFICGSCRCPQDSSCSAASVIRHFIKYRHAIMSFYSFAAGPLLLSRVTLLPLVRSKESGRLAAEWRNITGPLSSADALFPSCSAPNSFWFSFSPAWNHSFCTLFFPLTVCCSYLFIWYLSRGGVEQQEASLFSSLSLYVWIAAPD